jgi:probable phosphoglycerate mutase
MSEPSSYRQTRFTRPPGACEIILVRHGESEPAVEGAPFPTVDGHGDPALDPVGEGQAVQIADRLEHEPISAIYVTTLRRTHQTAAPLAARVGLTPVVEAELREVHLGEWENGMIRKYAAEGHPLLQQMYAEQRWDVLPGAEPAAAFEARVRAGIEHIATAHPDQLVVAVVHGGVIGQAIATACNAAAGLAFAGADNGSLSRLVVMSDRWMIRSYNETSHLV